MEGMIMNGPLHIDTVTTPGGGTIGMVHCPGRCTAPWQRELASDLAAIKAWPIDVLVSLVESHEFARLGVPGFAEAVQTAGIAWHHVPIRDMHTPGSEAAVAWAQSGPVILGALQNGGRIVLHCAAGLGRTGTIAAKLLMALGLTADEAIKQVRAARPGTIETAEQEDFVRTGPALGFMAPTAPDRQR
jgi:ADP-ribosyl-[dinitrogen reductase] hydrolase